MQKGTQWRQKLWAEQHMCCSAAVETLQGSVPTPLELFPSTFGVSTRVQMSLFRSGAAGVPGLSCWGWSGRRSALTEGLSCQENKKGWEISTLQGISLSPWFRWGLTDSVGHSQLHGWCWKHGCFSWSWDYSRIKNSWKETGPTF